MGLLEPETRWQRYAQQEGEDIWVWEHRYQRQIAVIDFLADPGYSTAAEIANVQRIASDVFPMQRLDQFYADIWPQHLSILKRETVGHAFTIGCPLAGWGLAKLGLFVPALVVLTLWLLVLCTEYLWAALAFVVRRALVMRSTWAEFDASFERHCLGKSISLWRRPAVWLIFPIVLRWRRRRAATAVQTG